MRLAPVGLLALALAACGRIGFDELQDCPANAYLCDDFETGTTAAWTASDASPNAVAQVTTARARSGQFALEADVPPAAMEGHYADVYLSRAVQTGVIAMREWIFAPSLFELFDEVMGLYTSDQQFMVFGCDNDGHWVAAEASVTTGLVDHYTTIPCVKNAWTCVEVVYSLDARHATFYIDDAIVLDFDVVDPAPQFAEIQAGATRADFAGFHVHVDDVVIAPQRIGCQ